LEKMSGVKFGDKFLNGLMKDKNYTMSSVMPSIAVNVFKSMKPTRAFEFAADVQSLFYYEGKSLNDAVNYGPLAEKYGIDRQLFLEKIQSAEWKAKTFDDFQKVSKLGINGFPALLVRSKEKTSIKVNGFEKYEDMVKVFDD
jgi:putative protein-disulfide isomerase